MIKDYTNESEESILMHGKKAIGLSFEEFMNGTNSKLQMLLEKSKTNKGFIGNYFQYAYYGIEPNSDKNPDFIRAGIELKVAGFRKYENGKLAADQRLVLSSINFDDYVKGVDLVNSSLVKKCNRMLMFFFYLDNNVDDRLKCKIHFMFDYSMFSIPKEDLGIIQRDYKKIVNKIKTGKAHEISEADTVFLSACRKDGKEEEYIVNGKTCYALPRRFAFKNSYITYLLNEYINAGKSCNTQVRKKTKIRDIQILKRSTFEEFVDKKLKVYIGKKDVQIAKRKKVNFTKFISEDSYRKHNTLSCKMLGIDSNQAPYLVKSAITIKALRISKTNYIDESISFPPFLFKEIVEEIEWIDSKTYDYLSERSFLFMIFKETDDGDFVFKGYKFYSLTTEELDKYFKPVWEETIRLLKLGFTLIPEKKGHEIIYRNPLPGMSYNGVCHIRPHSSKRAYKLKDGTIVGDWKKHANEMPDSQWMTTQSFWINNTYVMKLVREFLD